MICLNSCRGPAGEWYDAVCVLLRHSKAVREWFAKYVLFSHPDRFSEYLLECPSGEVRLCGFSLLFVLFYTWTLMVQHRTFLVFKFSQIKLEADTHILSFPLYFVGTKCFCKNPGVFSALLSPGRSMLSVPRRY